MVFSRYVQNLQIIKRRLVEVIVCKVLVTNRSAVENGSSGCSLRITVDLSWIESIF